MPPTQVVRDLPNGRCYVATVDPSIAMRVAALFNACPDSPEGIPPLTLTGSVDALRELEAFTTIAICTIGDE